MRHISTFFIVLIILCTLTSCKKSESEEMTLIPISIIDSHIYTAEILPEAFETPHFACIAIVHCEIHGGYIGFSDYKTEYPLQTPDNTFAQHPIYNTGDTLNVKMTEHRKTDVEDGITILDVAELHTEVVFLGFCTPGDYTLNINGVEKEFRVGKHRK